MIPYGRQHITNDDIASVVAVLKSDYLTTGPLVTAFENALSRLTGAKHVVVCSNGTTALHLACLSLGICKGELGVTSPITFLASANCIEYCGGHADFTDINPESLCLDPNALEEYCKSGNIPKVVIPVSYAGIPADLPAIKALSGKYGFKIIEDAAHAIGSTYKFKGKTFQSGSCAHSDLAVFSFHPVKTITTGEGGAVLTNSDKLAERLRRLRSHGMAKDIPIAKKAPWYYEMPEIGFNYRITDIQCALGLSQVKRIARIKKERQALVKTYNKAFQRMAGFITPPWPKGTSPCYHLYPVQFTGGERVRSAVYNALLKAGIQSQVHYIPVYWQPYYAKKYGYKIGMCPNAENYYRGCLSLPLFPGLTAFLQKKVISNTLLAKK